MSGQGQQGGDDRNTYMLLWALASIFIVSFATWFFFKKQLIFAFLFIRKYQLVAVSYVKSGLDTLIGRVDYVMANPALLPLEDAGQLSITVGEYLRYPAICILILMCFYLYKAHAAARFNKIYSMSSLAQQEKDNWPQISPVTHLDLVEEDINKGPWAVAMNPMQFAKKLQLLKVEIVPDPKAAWRSEGIHKATLIEDKAQRAFAAQLGPMWSGPEALPPHIKAIYAVFAARIEHQGDEAASYLKKLSSSAAKGEVDYSDTDTLISKYGGSKALQRVTQRHAYVYTLMATMLELSRTDGVLASADFLWLKPVDRRLWYMLNTVGRQVAPAEVGGPFAHWLAEKQMHRALNVPMVDEAINALKDALDKMIYIPDDEEEEGLELPGDEG